MREEVEEGGGASRVDIFAVARSIMISHQPLQRSSGLALLSLRASFGLGLSLSVFLQPVARHRARLIAPAPMSEALIARRAYVLVPARGLYRARRPCTLRTSNSSSLVA